MRAIIKTISTMDKGTVSVNIEATKMTTEDEIIKIFNDDNLVGVFDIGCVQFAYLSGKEKEQ